MAEAGIEMHEYQKLLKERLVVGQELLVRCEKLDSCVEGVSKLARKIKAEIKFLETLQVKKHPINTSHVKSTNLSHLEGVLKTAEIAEGVTALFKPFHICMVDQGAGIEQDITCIVDVVASCGATWIKVIARNPLALHRICQGEGQFGDKNLVEQAQEFLECSRHYKVHFMPPSVVFSFQSGITEGIARTLTDAGVCIWGQVIADPGKELETSLSEASSVSMCSRQEDKTDINRLNLDVSTMIAYVSAVTNGGALFVFQDAVLAAQAEKERKQPLLPKLTEHFRGKTLYACRSAVNDFNTIIKTIGGTKEKGRARQLLQRVTIVEDDPSERTMRLVDSASIKTRSKVVFGTGDTLKATTVSANASFVRGARSQGVEFSVFIHDSRALTESKEETATSILSPEDHC